MTVHEMVEEFDAGRIVAQREVAIRTEDSVCRLFAEQCRMAGEMLVEIILQIIERGEVGGHDQDTATRSYRGEPCAEDIARLRRRGHSLFKKCDHLEFQSYEHIDHIYDA